MTLTLELPVPGPAAAPPLLELRGIKAAYEQVEVLHGVDLAVPAGSVLAVLGPNGAGKTTMLKVASGLHAPSGGDIWLAGRCVTGAAPVDLARLGLCSIPEGRGVFPNLTVSENLWMASYRGVSRSEIEERVFPIFPRLKERRRQAAGTMSGGEQQMLAMARAIATDPAVLLIDELSMGLAPLVVEQLFEIVARIAGTGVTVLLVEQFAQTALGVADLAAVMTGGRITAVGTPQQIASGLHSAYLGGGGGGGEDPESEPPPQSAGTAATLLLPAVPAQSSGGADGSSDSTVVLPAVGSGSGSGSDRVTAYLGGEQAAASSDGESAEGAAGTAGQISMAKEAGTEGTSGTAGTSGTSRGETRGEPMSTNTAGVPPTVPAGTPVALEGSTPPPPALPPAGGPRSGELAQEVAGLRIKAPNTAIDKQLMWLGVALLVAGIGTALGAYIMAHTTRLELTQNDAIVVGLVGITISIAGMALFIRYSLSNFLRFWLARLIATSQQQGGGQPPTV
ncbi:branched-chain amino acid ABC transporter ATP-binding protein [Yinghuangia soli]|uniref:ABC transporter ATP-binding protein n=1 Tax=Yinghuangia soli TaxID=2908204 RepID=A0AA41PV33_9ACTN|nr:ABC transporter ATP-binding protein [Yinghuangia soli]MCF2525756.1 ABC transporter ATP-binding protein [Yinghuangia soli]